MQPSVFPQERHNILTSIEALGFRRVSIHNNEHYLCKVDFSDPPANNESSSAIETSSSSYGYRSSTGPDDEGPRSPSGKVIFLDRANGPHELDRARSIERSTRGENRTEKIPDAGKNNDEFVMKEEAFEENYDEEEQEDDGSHELVCQEILYVRTVDSLPH